MTARAESPPRPSSPTREAARDGRDAPLGSSGVYRPQLDGLRAVAVYLVVLFHAGSDRFVGGFVGVDVFFVLSGFLVTQLLLRDLVSVGSIGMGRFYARRVRRLLPAAVLTLVVTALVFAAVASPVEVADAVGAFRASLLYSANWFFVDQSADYFGPDLSSNPVLHFWSLAVEEQFYLLWPLLLGGLFALARRFRARQWQVLRLVVALGAVASLSLAWSLRETNPNRAYYGTDARAYQLMAGALVALTPGLVASLVRFARSARWVSAGGLVALGLVASSWVDLDAIERGMAVTAIAVVIIVALEAAGGGRVHGLLSADPVVYLGKVSYGTYLWHWPVILVMARSFDLSVISTIALTCLIATALASLSFQLIEHPIRVSGLLDRYRWPVIVMGLALSAASAVLIIPRVLDQPSTATTPTGTRLAITGFTPVPADLDFAAIKSDVVPLDDCLGSPADTCVRMTGAGAHVLVLGDSYASMMIPALEPAAESHDLTLSAFVGCPWQRGLFTSLVGSVQARCSRAIADAYDRVIPELDPDVVIVMNAPYEQPGLFASYLGPDGTVLPKGSAELSAWLERTTEDSLAELRSGGRKVVIIEPTPTSGDNFDPLECLSDAAVIEECRYVVDRSPSGLELLYRRLDRAAGDVWAADLDQLVCPFHPICDPIVDGRVVKFDGGHLVRSYARVIAPAVTSYLAGNGVIP